MAYKSKIFVSVTWHFMDTKVNGINKEKEICLPKKEYISGHR